MPLKQAGIMPHPPLLIKSIGKENTSKLEKTISSYRKFEENLKNKKIETIIIISSHGPIDSEIFHISRNNNYIINFEEFGDYTSKIEVKADIELIDDIIKSFSAQKKLEIITENILDHGVGVPIFSLCQNIKDIKIVPIHICRASLKDHFYFGKKLKTIIEKNKKNIAIIASGDMSHTLNKKAPAGYSARASRFDQKVIEYIQNNKIADVLNIKDELIDEVKPCGIKSIAVLLGVLKGTKHEISNTTYEAPFGVGYLTMEMDII